MYRACIEIERKISQKFDNVESKSRKAAYGLVIKDDKVLVIKPNFNDAWEFPGGGKKDDKTIYDALIMY